MDIDLKLFDEKWLEFKSQELLRFSIGTTSSFKAPPTAGTEPQFVISESHMIWSPLAIMNRAGPDFSESKAKIEDVAVFLWDYYKGYQSRMSL